MAHDLAERLASFSDRLSEAERAEYKFLLALACGGLLAEGGPPAGDRRREAFRTTVASLAGLQPHRRRVTSSGIAWRGRPDFVTDELLGALRRESRSLRGAARRFDDHLVSTGTDTARQVAFSEQLLDLVKRYAGEVIPTGKTNYLYYDEEGLGIDPHIDNEEFPLNTIMMLEHEHEGDPSALVLYPRDSDPIRILLEPGELIVVFADSVVHARERMKKNERVSIVAFGFQPIGNGEAND